MAEIKTVYDGWSFYPTHNQFKGRVKTEHVERLPPGYYEIWMDNNGHPCVQLLEQRIDNTIASSCSTALLDEVDRFWDSESVYGKLNLTHKRGLLLYGPAGCGKTTAIQQILSNVRKRNGIAIRPFNGSQQLMPKLENLEKRLT